MMAFKCDGCREFFEGKMIVIDPHEYIGANSTYITTQSFGEPDQYHFCSWICVARYATSRAESEYRPVDAITSDDVRWGYGDHNG